MAFAAARLAARFAMSRGARRAAAYSARQAYRSAARAASRAGRYTKLFARRNPMTTGFMAGGAAENIVRASRKRNLKSIRKGRIVKPRKAGPVPSAPSSRVTANYAVAPRMTKMKRPIKAKEPKVKSVINHYKEFGKFTAEKCVFINHEHIGSRDKLWIGIANGLTKALLAKGRIYPSKSYEDPVIGPLTDFRDQLDNKVANSSVNNKIQLVFTSETPTGEQSVSSADVNIDDSGVNPDKYRSFAAIAEDVATVLEDKYNDNVNRSWLSHAMLTYLTGAHDYGTSVAAINNLDDAEIHLYVNSLVKFQNVTTSDAGSLDKQSIDANPLTGRIYEAKGISPQIDTELATVGNKSLDRFFMETNQNTGGLTMCGFNSFNADDVGRVSHIPHANQIYGHQTVKTGLINMAPGAMKFHKSSFKIVKTFKELSKYMTRYNSTPTVWEHTFGRHTLFGLKCAHKHGQDTIQIGWNRDTDVGCYVKLSNKIYNLKTNYTNDYGDTGTGLVQTTAPTEHLRRVP